MLDEGPLETSIVFFFKFQLWKGFFFFLQNCSLLSNLDDIFSLFSQLAAPDPDRTFSGRHSGICIKNYPPLSTTVMLGEGLYKYQNCFFPKILLLKDFLCKIFFCFPIRDICFPFFSRWQWQIQSVPKIFFILSPIFFPKYRNFSRIFLKFFFSSGVLAQKMVFDGKNCSKTETWH